VIAAVSYVACPWESNVTHPGSAPVHVLIGQDYYVRLDELLAWLVAHHHEQTLAGRAE
jgi:hypothetical protein